MNILAKQYGELTIKNEGPCNAHDLRWSSKNFIYITIEEVQAVHKNIMFLRISRVRLMSHILELGYNDNS